MRHSWLPGAVPPQLITLTTGTGTFPALLSADPAHTHILSYNIRTMIRMMYTMLKLLPGGWVTFIIASEDWLGTSCNIGSYTFACSKMFDISSHGYCALRCWLTQQLPVQVCQCVSLYVHTSAADAMCSLRVCLAIGHIIQKS